MPFGEIVAEDLRHVGIQIFVKSLQTLGHIGMDCAFPYAENGGARPYGTTRFQYVTRLFERPDLR